jgi:glycosyltransferase involved in cell wall biosynthesis
MRATVCIPTIRAAALGRTVRSVLGQTWQDWELLVVGQGDAANEAVLRAAVSEVAGHDPRVTYVHLRELGCSRARNAGTRLCRGEVIAFLDDDCEADPSWLETIVTAFDADPELGAVGGAVVGPEKLGALTACPTVMPAEAVYDPALTPQSPPAGWDWIGANCAFRLTAAARVGLWDEAIGPGMPFPVGEDTDYKQRLEALGIRMLTTPRSRILHSSGVRSGRAALRSQRNYALGNGALAAKQSLSGDPRGRAWLRATRRRCLTDWARRGRPLRLPVDLRHLLWFELGYRRCRRLYEVDPAGLLRLSGSASAGSVVQLRPPHDVESRHAASGQ